MITGRIRKGEKWINFIAPLIEPEEKANRKPKSKSRRRSKIEDRFFLLECIEQGLISREDYDYIIKHPKKGGD
ncbi:hypothetical protein [Paenibacillus sp. FSL W8-0194]|uniref:hypothetical protein n=1 Tax=Paenibacillus sp. FSL W8-0194 TaxID=2921711 RepID=UPI0030D982C4